VHLVGLVESEGHVCCRYRLAALRPHLAAAGHTLELRPLPRSTLGRLSLGRGLDHADVVILQRKLLPRWATARLRRRARRLVFDFDDAVWLRDSYSPKGFDDPRRAARFRAVVAACDLVVAGNEYLAAEARRCTSPGRVTVIPTCVDAGKYMVRSWSERAIDSPPAERADHTPIQLVWVGSSSTLRGLARFAPTLAAIGRGVPGARLKLVCDRFLDVPDLPVDRCPWDEATEPAQIAAADVGIGWVPDDPWSRGKCGLKVLQYQAAGLPVVANPVGVQAEFVQDGETGLHAVSTGEWVTAVKKLAADPGLCRRLGAAGRRQVETHYSVGAGAGLWLAALDRLAGEDRLRKSG
jgi:glycosyltransferase involved in cell wall biosynthesis